ncbi:SURF1 family protein [Janthinobacterium sp. BJB1]|uniref:SURF1 family protein n=1 Tax=Janthinobacterium sp. GW458P TaxID=1981504 RepID=UPI000A3280A8|nr:SURF1 family protein [Janthinobacterium sp. GW458P]MBE3027182.1 SURF1 family protein [Janthinobacterium sp. GW458P]PHV15389.1 SURF1 family protein [Janthinobacterium sp. BJB303]PJC97535.1 SURF1 family protein [Janthinobacterium sp. BJB1]
MRIRFHFRWIPFVVMLLLVALGVSLAQWQQRRADEKIARAARLEAGNQAAPLALGAAPLSAAEAQAIEYRRVTVTGRFVPAWTVYLDNRPYQGQAGFHVLTPFQIDGSPMHVLVAQGWLPRNNAERTRIPDYATPAGTVTITGIARLNAGHVMELGTAPPLAPHAIVQNADIAQLAQASGLALQPLVIEQTADGAMATSGQLPVRDWPAPDLGADKHRGYAFQWYALALMAFLFFVFTGFRRANKQP